jgi:hypothetical protein
VFLSFLMFPLPCPKLRIICSENSLVLGLYTFLGRGSRMQKRDLLNNNITSHVLSMFLQSRSEYWSLHDITLDVPSADPEVYI